MFRCDVVCESRWLVNLFIDIFHGALHKNTEWSMKAKTKEKKKEEWRSKPYVIFNRSKNVWNRIVLREFREQLVEAK